MFQRLLWYSPIVLLCTIAIWQIQRAHSSDLTPWKGGGFGMFSTVDQPQMRFVKVYLIDGEKESPIALPESEGPAFERVKADPSEEHLQWVADHLAKHGLSRLQEWAVPTWVLESDSESPQEVEDPSDKNISDQKAEQPRLRVELWRLKFDQQKKEVVAYKHLESVVELNAEAHE